MEAYYENYNTILERRVEKEKFSSFLHGCLHTLYETVTSKISNKSL